MGREAVSDPWNAPTDLEDGIATLAPKPPELIVLKGLGSGIKDGVDYTVEINVQENMRLQLHLDIGEVHDVFSCLQMILFSSKTGPSAPQQ